MEGPSASRPGNLPSKPMDCIKNHLADDEGIYLRGFGTFILKKRAAKTARDINKKSTVFVPAHRVVNFKPSKELADKVR